VGNPSSPAYHRRLFLILNPRPTRPEIVAPGCSGWPPFLKKPVPPPPRCWRRAPLPSVNPTPYPNGANTETLLEIVPGKRPLVRRDPHARPVVVRGLQTSGARRHRPDGDELAAANRACTSAPGGQARPRTAYIRGSLGPRAYLRLCVRDGTPTLARTGGHLKEFLKAIEGADVVLGRAISTGR